MSASACRPVVLHGHAIDRQGFRPPVARLVEVGRATMPICAARLHRLLRSRRRSAQVRPRPACRHAVAQQAIEGCWASAPAASPCSVPPTCCGQNRALMRCPATLWPFSAPRAAARPARARTGQSMARTDDSWLTGIAAAARLARLPARFSCAWISPRKIAAELAWMPRGCGPTVLAPAISASSLSFAAGQLLPPVLHARSALRLTPSPDFGTENQYGPPAPPDDRQSMAAAGTNPPPRPEPKPVPVRGGRPDSPFWRHCGRV